MFSALGCVWGCVWVEDGDVFTKDLGAQGLQRLEGILGGHVLILSIGDGCVLIALYCCCSGRSSELRNGVCNREVFRSCG